REGVDAHEYGFAPVAPARIEQRLDGLVIGAVDLVDPACALRGIKIVVGGDVRRLGQGPDRLGGFGDAVGSDEQAGHGRMHDRRVERVRQGQGDSQCARIPGDVADEFDGAQAQVAIAVGNAAGSVVADENERRASVRIQHLNSFCRRTVHDLYSAPLQGCNSSSGNRTTVNPEMAVSERSAPESLSVEARIHEAMHRLTSAEKRVARGLLGSYPTIGFAPVAEFAAQSGTSAA